LGVGGRTFFQFLDNLFYFWFRAGTFEGSGRQNTVILLCFCLLLVPRRWIWPCEQTKTSRKADFGCREHCILP
ncbi:hypothetical protein, partial [Ligilactobacillus ruminis]|uniref:hypothetical protein n=1 Tax=Ligilactobacillus ruminis TaxID=1623 RepID=UPI0034A1199E